MRLAIFDMNAAERIIGKYDYQTWLLSGHSVGGIAAANCAADNSDVVDGVVLLASYPNTTLPDKISLLSIYGSEDKVLEKDAYEKAKSNYPANADEVVIHGGNHAQFGIYGTQQGDEKATITREEQQKKTVDAILRMKRVELNRR